MAINSGTLLSDNLEAPVSRANCINVERFSSAMQRQGFSQARLAKEAGVSPATVQQILNGSTQRTRAIISFAHALSVTPEWLEGGSEAKKPDMPAMTPYETAKLRLAVVSELRSTGATMEEVEKSTPLLIAYLLNDAVWQVRDVA